MRKRRLKSFVVPLIYILSIVILVLSVYFVEGLIRNGSNKLKDKPKEVEEVINQEPVEENNIPVVNTEPTIMRPYTNPDVKILKNFYDYQGDANSQEGAIVYYGNTYMQNSGVDYGCGKEFDVVSILDGTVMEVTEDEVMGKTVKIKYSNDIIGVYQSMGSINVNVNDNISIGNIIGKSGENNVGKDLGNHLHFELFYQGSVVNPENYYDKLPSQLS